QRALAGTGGSHHGEPLAGMDLEVHVVERSNRAEMARHAIEPDQRSIHRHSPLSAAAGWTASASRMGPRLATPATAIDSASTIGGTSHPTRTRDGNACRPTNT